MLSTYPFSLLFLSTLGISTIIALSRNNWIIIWARMELNLLSIIPLITSTSSNQETEAAIKYFFAQAIGSASFLAAVILISSSRLYFLFPANIPFILFFFRILIKAGAAPCHYWLPNVIARLNWLLCLLLTTWQKIIPIWLIIHILSFNSSSFTPIYIGALGAMIGGLGGINQTQIRPLLAYSSINHIGWIISCATLSTFLRLTYFSIYILSLIPIIIMLLKTIIKSTSQSTSFNKLTPSSKTWLMLLFLSLGGLPPLFGFVPKLLTLMVLISQKLLIISLILILGSLLSLYYYLTIFFNLSINHFPSSLNKTITQTPLSPYSFSLLSSIALIPIILSLIYALIIFY